MLVLEPLSLPSWLAPSNMYFGCGEEGESPFPLLLSLGEEGVPTASKLELKLRGKRNVKMSRSIHPTQNLRGRASTLVLDADGEQGEGELRRSACTP